MTYPKHISDFIRIEVAANYLRGELEKLFPSIENNGIERLWEKLGPRDFWNGWWGIAMGFKLKVGFIQVITAANVTWEKTKLNLDNKLASGGGLTYISKELSEKRPRASRLKEFFRANPQLAEKWREQLTNQGSKTRDQLPITAMQEVDDNQPIMSVHDGNRQMVLSVLMGRTSIAAYVGRYTTDKLVPENFWLPTSFLMELVLEGQLTNDYKGALEMLKRLVKLSDSGEYELKERVLIGENEFRVRLKKDLS